MLALVIMLPVVKYLYAVEKKINLPFFTCSRRNVERETSSGQIYNKMQMQAGRCDPVYT